VPLDSAWHPLADGNPPEWASAWAQDKFGVSVSFTLPSADRRSDVSQRLRWIPPGRFLMGSAEAEAGRWNDEGPQHEVTISRGFWLADTPCTQALWQAVIGNNPSRFKSTDRPVEQVSWDAVQAFLASINKRIPGLDLVLPTEAQWEYACRAGTDTATYAGDLRIFGENNAPALDTIAWYGGNSGEGFELDEGEDSSGWPKKQYPHTKAGTRLVGLKEPNAWGLYDMLGNVLEWCADPWHGNYEGAPADGSIWHDPNDSGAKRVLRGGFWGKRARRVRSAYRRASVPGYRHDCFGFRCAQVQL